MKKISVILFCFVSLVLVAGVFYLQRHVNRDTITAAKTSENQDIHIPDLLLFQIKGRISQGKDGILFLTSAYKDNRYVLVGEKTGDLKQYLDKDTELIGKIIPSDPEVLGGKPVKCNIDVIAFGNNLIPENSQTSINESLLESIQEKIAKKKTLHLQILSKLKKNETFNAIKGKVSSEYREVEKDAKGQFVILRSDDEDVYLLGGSPMNEFVKNFPEYSGKTFIAVGEESLPNKGYPLKTGEILFNVKELYDGNFNRIDR